MVRLHPHARERMPERGATEEEIQATVAQGEQFPAKFGRTGFRRNFQFDQEWRGWHYRTKQVEAYAVQEGADWLVITIITCSFERGERRGCYETHIRSPLQHRVHSLSREAG